MDPVRLSNNLLPPTLPVHPREAQPAVLEPAVIGDAVALGPIPTLPTETAPLPQPTVTVARTPQPAIPMTLTEGTQTPAGAAPYTYPSGPNGPRTPESRIVADRCREIAFSGRPLQDRAKEIGDILVEAVDGANSPNPAWEIATSEQVRLFVLETLEHTDAIRRLGELRGLDFHEHDFEGDTSKFNPEITRFLARPGRDDSVKWVINEHNAAPHHHLWKDPNANADDLREGATDIVNAWRMNRRVYEKPAWSWEKINRVIEVDFEDGKLTAPQRDALIAAIPFQMQDEATHGLPT